MKAEPIVPKFTNVLVIDDDEISQAVARIALQGLGIIDIRTADNGSAGLASLDETPPELLVCDIFMPDQDGIEIVNSLADRGYRGALVLASGGDFLMLQIAGEIAKEKGLALLGVMTKPLMQDRLAAILGLIPQSAT